MNKLLIMLFATIIFPVYSQSQPIALHPENPHYFIFKGKPTVLVTSAEHYGAVLNRDFDYKKYLQTMHNEGMNYTRIFTGSYVEIPGSFGIEKNSLAPAADSFIAPWKRTAEPGLFNGETKFDLNEWNPEYFDRLTDFVKLAAELDIVVEVTLFCATYDDRYWERHPFNPENNVNGIALNLERKKSNTLANGILTAFQQKLVEKLVIELNSFDNVFYEVQNEPWADDGVKVMRTLRTLDPQPGQGDWYKWAEMASAGSLEWQQLIAKTIVATESVLPKKHLIAQNYTNFFHSVDTVDPNISIMNFHYVWPEAVWMNYGWNRPVSFDESGFAGSADSTYLSQAWQFMMAGGAVFNNLDYSFYAGKEDGTGTNKAPGGGSKNLRKQLTYLRNFVESFNFIKMKPDFTVVAHAPGLQAHAISESGKQYAMVFSGMTKKPVELNLPKGKYDFEIYCPITGKTIEKANFRLKKDGKHKIQLPENRTMTALKITN